MFRQHGDLKFSRIVGMAGESVEVKQGNYIEMIDKLKHHMLKI